MGLKLSYNKEFIRSIAKDIKKMSKDKLDKKVISLEAESDRVKKDAIETAKAYWLSGWNFEEIQARLEDEYNSLLVENTMRRISEYVDRVTKNGPFRVGQKIKLKTGELVKVARFNNKKIVAVTEENDSIIFEKDVVDEKASDELRQADYFRQKAKKLLRAAEPKEYIVPETPPQAWQTHTETPNVSEESYKTKIQKSTPSGWGDIAPDVGEVEEIDKVLQESINNILGLKEMEDELQSQIAGITSKLNEVRKEQKSLQIEEQEELKKLFLLSNSVYGGLEALNQAVFGDYLNKIVGLRTTVLEKEQKPGTQDELNALKEIIEVNHPKIAKKVFRALDEYMESFTVIKKRIENTFAYFEYRKHPRKKGQLIQKFKDFFKSIWNKIESATSSILNTIVPETEDIIAELNTAEKSLAATAMAKRVEKVFIGK